MFPPRKKTFLFKMEIQKINHTFHNISISLSEFNAEYFLTYLFFSIPFVKDYRYKGHVANPKINHPKKLSWISYISCANYDSIVVCSQMFTPFPLVWRPLLAGICTKVMGLIPCSLTLKAVKLWCSCAYSGSTWGLWG